MDREWDEKEFLTEKKTTEVDFKDRKRVLRFRCPTCHVADFFHITGDITVEIQYSEEEDEYFASLGGNLMLGQVACAECGTPVEQERVAYKVMTDAQWTLESATQKVTHPDFDEEKFQKRVDELMKESRGEETE